MPPVSWGMRFGEIRFGRRFLPPGRGGRSVFGRNFRYSCPCGIGIRCCGSSAVLYWQAPFHVSRCRDRGLYEINRIEVAVLEHSGSAPALRLRVFAEDQRRPDSAMTCSGDQSGSPRSMSGSRWNSFAASTFRNRLNDGQSERLRAVRTVVCGGVPSGLMLTQASFDAWLRFCPADRAASRCAVRPSAGGGAPGRLQ